MTVETAGKIWDIAFPQLLVPTALPQERNRVCVSIAGTLLPQPPAEWGARGCWGGLW